MRTIKKRRKQGKTDYKARLRLLEGRTPRIVVRKTNKYIIAQFVKSEESRDKVIIGITSKDLLEYGWDKTKAGSLKSIPAAYLTGLLLGEKMKEKKEKEAILDIGLTRSIKKGRIYAVLNGVVDSGININCKKEIFPDEKRIKGEHIKNKIDFEKIKKNIQK